WVGVNASPLIVLAKVRRLDLLAASGVRLVTTQAVIREIAAAGPADPVHVAVQGLGWLQVVDDPTVSSEVTAANLGPGESTLLAWAMQAPGRELILDDLHARTFARRHGIIVHGTLSLVLAAKRSSKIAAARPVFEELRRA